MQTEVAPASVKAVEGDEGTFEAIVSVFGNVDPTSDLDVAGAARCQKHDPSPDHLRVRRRA